MTTIKRPPSRRTRARRATLAASSCAVACALLAIAAAEARQSSHASQSPHASRSSQAATAQSQAFQSPSVTSSQSPAAARPAEASAARPAWSPLTEQERRGKAVYLRGESASGREIVASLGELEVPAATMTCAGCHGARGEGKTEGGVTAGALVWSHLTKPYGHEHPTGRRHGPFGEMAFIRAVSNGTDPAGNALLVAMPRYRMSAEDMADLLAYLKRVEDDRDPGLADDSIRVGMLVPARGALAETGRAVRAVTAAYFEEVNRRGGIYGRRVELKVAEAGDTAAATAASFEQLIQQGQVFAVVNAFTAGAEREVAAVVARHEVPLVGSHTLLTPTGTPPERHAFHLLPGVSEQARALVNFAARGAGGAKPRAAVAYPRNVLGESAAAAVAEQLRAVGWDAPARVAYEQGRFDAAASVAELRRADAQVVFFMGAGDEGVFLAEAARAGWFPRLYLLGALAGGGVLGAHAGFKDRIFLAFPSAPSNVSPDGLARFRALAESHALPARHVASQISALAAAQVLADAFKRAGRDLSREGVIAALEKLYDFDTGLTPRLTFGPNRRVGASGAHIVAADLERKQYVPVGDWVSAGR